MIETDVILVGGGLSGLALADHLQSAGIDYHLFEAREQLGGRVRVGRIDSGQAPSGSRESDNGLAAFDLGPSWFWPGQPRMRALVDRLGLSVFEQYSTGAPSFEDESGRVQRGQGYASMEGSYRIAGGLSGLVDGLAGLLEPARLHVGAKVRTLRHRGQIEVLDSNANLLVRGRRLVLALPPRVAAELVFEPALPAMALQALSNVPTWMAGQAKFVAAYQEAFWREDGLSGDAMSRLGPLVEIHDATDPVSGLGALFGFVGVPARARVNQGEALRAAALDQLERIFGDKARAPIKVWLQDWAAEAETASAGDLVPLAGHPSYGLPESARDLWGGRLLFGSTEVASQFGGYLEGALEAAEQIAAQLCLTTAAGATTG